MRIKTDEDGKAPNTSEQIARLVQYMVARIQLPRKCKVMEIVEGARRSNMDYGLRGQRLQTSLREKDLWVSTVPSIRPDNTCSQCSFGKSKINLQESRSFWTLYKSQLHLGLCSMEPTPEKKKFRNWRKCRKM